MFPVNSSNYQPKVNVINNNEQNSVQDSQNTEKEAAGTCLSKTRSASNSCQEFSTINNKQPTNNNVLSFPEKITSVEPRAEPDAIVNHGEQTAAEQGNNTAPIDLTAWFKAARKKDPAVILALLKKESVDINVRDNDKRTALHLAVCRNNLEVVLELLKHDTLDVNARDKNGMTALHSAIFMSDPAIVLALLKHPDIDANVKSNDGKTALHYTVENRGVELVDKLLRHDGIDPNTKDNAGETALHYAVEKRDVALIETLLKHGGIDATVKDNEGKTALHYAVQKRDVALIETLLKHGGIDATVKDNEVKTAFHYAVEKRDLVLIETLLKHGGIDANVKGNAGKTALHYAVEKGDLMLIKALLEYCGIDPSTKDNAGKTALHYAVEKGDVVLIETLLKHEGIDANVKDNAGKTALHYAAEKENRVLVTALLEHDGIDINAKYNDEKTVLHYVVKKGDVVLINILLKHGGINATAKDNAEKTAWHYAMENMNVEVILALLDCCAIDVRKESLKNESIFYITQQREWLRHEVDDAKHKNSDLAINRKGRNNQLLDFEQLKTKRIKMLTELFERKNADLNKKDSDGNTPLHLAILNGSRYIPGIFETLLSKEGVLINEQNNEGNTALHLACQLDVSDSVKGSLNTYITHLCDQNNVNFLLKNNNGQIPFHFLVQATKYYCGFEESYGKMLEYDYAQLDAKDNENRTPLHIATATAAATAEQLTAVVAKEHLLVVYLLLEYEDIKPEIVHSALQLLAKGDLIFLRDNFKQQRRINQDGVKKARVAKYLEIIDTLLAEQG